MLPVNPSCVRVPDGRTGTLVARVGLVGCVEFKTGGRLERYGLATLNYLTPTRRRVSDKS